MVGGEASGGSDVGLGNFSLQTDAGATVIDVLEVQSSRMFPLHVDKGSSERVSFTFKADAQWADDLCDRSMTIVGTMEDSLSGNSQPVRSAPITPVCTPYGSFQPALRREHFAHAQRRRFGGQGFVGLAVRARRHR